MLSLIAPGSTIRPVASASPQQVKTACHGRRSMFLNAIRKVGLKNRVRPMRSKNDGLKSAGGSGRIASAGGSFTACQTTVRTPSTETVPGLCGYIDRDGDWVIAANYENARPFSEGLAAVQIEPLGSWGYIDPTGAVVIPLEWDGAEEFQGGLARVSVLVGSDEDLGPLYGYAYIDTQGQAVWQDAALVAFRAAPPTTTIPEASTTTVLP